MSGGFATAGAGLFRPGSTHHHFQQDMSRTDLFGRHADWSRLLLFVVLDGSLGLLNCAGVMV
jgi:hypothetical protein